MTCERCGSAEVSVRRGRGAYCVSCAILHEWETIIAIAQTPVPPRSAVEFTVEPASTPKVGRVPRAPADPFA